MCEPRLDARELEYITDCVRTGWISSAGPYLDRFETAWAAYCGRREGVAVSNGTAALEAAVRCLDLQPGDEVILPTFTIISCVLAVLRGGAHPVLVDADPDTWCLDVGQVELSHCHSFGHQSGGSSSRGSNVARNDPMLRRVSLRRSPPNFSRMASARTSASIASTITPAAGTTQTSERS